MSNRTRAQSWAYGVQMVCISLGFHDFDQLLLPYLVFDMETLTLSTIASCSDGYSLKTFSYTLGTDTKQTTTSDEVFSWAVAFPDSVDARMRELGRKFSADQGNEVLHNFHYEMKPKSP
ncbi:unnamed protein product [Agarophyton chilense]